MLQVIQAFVRQAIAYVDQTPDKEVKVSLIKTLQTVTEGKVRQQLMPGVLASSAILCTSTCPYGKGEPGAVQLCAQACDR